MLPCHETAPNTCPKWTIKAVYTVYSIQAYCPPVSWGLTTYSQLDQGVSWTWTQHFNVLLSESEARSYHFGLMTQCSKTSLSEDILVPVFIHGCLLSEPSPLDEKQPHMTGLNMLYCWLETGLMVLYGQSLFQMFQTIGRVFIREDDFTLVLSSPIQSKDDCTFPCRNHG